MPFIRLTDSTSIRVDQYAAFIHALTDEVVEQSLAYVFAKAKGFQKLIQSPGAKRITPTFCVHRALPPTQKN